MVMESSHFYDALVLGANEVILYKDDLNLINVFPVADGDTGTNLNATMQALLQYIKKDENLSILFQTAAHGAFVGARGNSGIIFAQFIDFCSQEMPSKPFITLSEFAELVGKAVKRLYQCVLNPTEGTILSLMSAWSHSLADNKNKCANVADCISRSIEDCWHTLLDTPNQLPILKHYGVVDSGAKGFYCFLLGFQKSFCGTAGVTAKVSASSKPKVTASLTLPEYSHKQSNFRYCCEALLTGNMLNRQDIQDQLAPLGDSVLAVGDDSQLKVHIHTDLPSLVFAELRASGTVWEPKVEDMHLQQAVQTSRKSSIAIVTDSIADIPADFILENQIFVIPFLLEIDGILYLDRLTLTEEEFTILNPTARSQPKTSLASVLQIQRLFDYLAGHYKEVAVLSVSSQLSGSYSMLSQFAKQWQTDHPDARIAVIDTRKNSGAQGLLVMEACALAQQGCSLASLVAEIEGLRDNTHILVAMHTTRYLARSGRVSQRTNHLAQWLHIKPVLGLNLAGAGITFGAALTQKSLVRKIIRIIKKEQKHYTIRSFSLVHGQNLTGAHHFAQAIQQQTGCHPCYVSTISPIVQAIAGEKAIAISYIRQRKDSL